MIGRPDLIFDPLFNDGIYRLAHAEDFLALLRPWLAERTRAEIVAECEALRVPFGAVLKVPDLLEDPQLLARDHFAPLEMGRRVVRVPGPLYRVRPAANPKESSLGSSRSPETAALQDDGNVSPLSGIRVVDLSWVWAGPSATRILADLGADVVKIEAPHRPDSVRALVQDANISHPDYWNRGGYFNEKNLGKRDMTLDIARPEGKEIFLQLVRQADVLVESFSPRVMSQLGIDFDRLAEERPGLIMVSLSGYGQTGPGKNRVAYGAALEPEAGITDTIGYPDGPPVKSGLAYTDPISGVVAAGAILQALHDRITGTNVSAVHIDLAEREVVLPFITEQIIEYQLNGHRPSRQENRHPRHWPQGCYRCAGHDRWVVLTVTEDDQWRELAGLVGLQESRDLTTIERQANADTIDRAIGAFCSARDPYAIVRTLQAFHIPSAVVQNGRDIYFDPQLRSRQFFEAVDHPLVGRKEYHRFLGATFEKTRHEPGGPAPLLDQHTAAILETLGFSSDEVGRLRASGVWGHQLVEGSRTNLALPLDVLLSLGAVSCVDVPPVVPAG